MTPRLSPAQLEQRRTAALVHGAYSPRKIATKARSKRRTFLARLGVQARDMDPFSAALLKQWSEGAARLDLLNEADADGNSEFWAAYNATRRTLIELERRLAANPPTNFVGYRRSKSWRTA